ncbi:MAG: hypothetical protein WED04_02945 [Promethearchaeati archaeon SRVP18_Atabeyarchaeia-1]
MQKVPVDRAVKIIKMAEKTRRNLDLVEERVPSQEVSPDAE